MRGLGKGNCWNNYADTCLEVDIDGSTMLDATAGILQELGFHKIHANKVIATLQKRQNFGEISTNNTNSAFERPEYVHGQSSGTHIPKSPSSVSGRFDRIESAPNAALHAAPSRASLSQKEAERMRRFSHHSGIMETCGMRLTHAVANLKRNKNGEVERCKATFDKILAKIESERVKCRDDIDSRCNQMRKILVSTLETIKNHREGIKTEAKTLYKAMQISNWSKRNDRMDVILKVTRSAIEKQQPVLANKPGIQVTFNSIFESAVREEHLFEVEQRDPIFDQETSEESKRQRDIEEMLKEERERQKLRKEQEREREAILAEKHRRQHIQAALEAKARRLSELKTWTELPLMNSKRRYLGVVISPDASNLYALGGYHDSEYLRSVEELDFEARVWRPVAPMSRARCGLGVAMSPDGSRIFAVGGYDGPGFDNYLNTVEVFDFESRKWTFLAPMKHKRAHFGLAISPDGGKLYAVGGRNKKRLDSAEVFDIARNTWSDLPPMISGRSGLGAAISPDGKKLYIVGGYDGSQLNTVEELDLSKRKWGRQRRFSLKKFMAPCSSDRIEWKQHPTMHEHRRYLGVTISPDGSRLYAVGGDEENNTAEYFDFDMEQWVVLPSMASKRRGLGVAISPDGKRLFAVGDGNSGEWLRVN